MAQDEIERRLLALPGIGPWTVAYIAMRALRDPDAFMPTDLGVRHGLERLGCDGRPPSAERIAERWRPVPCVRDTAPVGPARVAISHGLNGPPFHARDDNH